MKNRLDMIKEILGVKFNECADCDFSWLPLGGYETECPKCGEVLDVYDILKDSGDLDEYDEVDTDFRGIK